MTSKPSATSSASATRFAERGRPSANAAKAHTRPKPATLVHAATALVRAQAAGQAQAQPATWESWGGRVANQLLKLMPVRLSVAASDGPAEPLPWRLRLVSPPGSGAAVLDADGDLQLDYAPDAQAAAAVPPGTYREKAVLEVPPTPGPPPEGSKLQERARP